jgi:hypothetical protein
VDISPGAPTLVMTPYLGAANDGASGIASPQYSLLHGTKAALKHLLDRARAQLPEESRQHIDNVDFLTANTGTPYFPSPLKQTEAISALKAVEAGVAATIADLKEATQGRKINVHLERASAFLFSTYLATVGGMDKAHPKVKKLLKDTDLLQAQSILYRRLSANLTSGVMFTENEPD